MVTKGVIVALAFLALADRGLSLTCRSCYKYEETEDGQKVKVSKCGPTPTCIHGLVKDRGVCGCCDVCVKGPGESCGGFIGSCLAGYWCVGLPDYTTLQDGHYGSSICVSLDVIAPIPELETTTSVPTNTEFEITTNVSTTEEIVTTFPWTCGRYHWQNC